MSGGIGEATPRLRTFAIGEGRTILVLDRLGPVPLADVAGLDGEAQGLGLAGALAFRHAVDLCEDSAPAGDVGTWRPADIPPGARSALLHAIVALSRQGRDTAGDHHSRALARDHAQVLRDYLGDDQAVEAATAYEFGEPALVPDHSRERSP